MKSEEYAIRQIEIGGWPISIETYKVGQVYYCSISNVDPGARVARAQGPTKEDAERVALDKAERYLQQTRRFPTA